MTSNFELSGVCLKKPATRRAISVHRIRRNELHPSMVIFTLRLAENKHSNIMKMNMRQFSLKMDFHSETNKHPLRYSFQPVGSFMRRATFIFPLISAPAKRKIVESMSVGRKYELPSYFRSIEWHSVAIMVEFMMNTRCIFRQPWTLLYFWDTINSVFCFYTTKVESLIANVFNLFDNNHSNWFLRKKMWIWPLNCSIWYTRNPFFVENLRTRFA